MWSLGSIAFAAPWLLAGLAALPVLWWLLRVTPPAPKRVRFPALRLMLGLAPPEETPAKTPLWLILLRMVLATAVILALAQPLLNPRTPIAAAGPVVFAVDDGWGAARHWDDMRAALDRLIDQAGREGREIVIFGTADPPGGRAPSELSLLRPADARAVAANLQPLSWPDDRAQALARFERLGLSHAAEVVWLSDGLDGGDAAAFAAGLAHHGPLTVMGASGNALPRLLAPADADDKDLTAMVERADPSVPETLTLRALGDDGRLMARRAVTVPAGQGSIIAHIPMPTELRNRVASIAIENEASAGAVLLLDERWKRRPVGIVARRDVAQPLLSGAYYLDKALSPFSEVRTGDVATLIKGGIAVLALPDDASLSDGDRQAIAGWLDKGGTVVRFAGPRLAAQPDDALLPVRLRSGDRTLGGALSWERPAKLAPFTADSPFAGLAIPDDVTVSRQVLAEPTVNLAQKTWARLADGTPLVTAAKHGKGWIVLVHTTADPEWSNLAISGLMVEM
ncbi:MAG: BatA domain-containing protein, partial [Stellaceae bacterium]